MEAQKIVSLETGIDEYDVQLGDLLPCAAERRICEHPATEPCECPCHRGYGSCGRCSACLARPVLAATLRRKDTVIRTLETELAAEREKVAALQIDIAEQDGCLVGLDALAEWARVLETRLQQASEHGLHNASCRGCDLLDNIRAALAGRKSDG